jgi:hypothetical protein
MNCPRCERHIADGFYCVGCGYVPMQIDARTNTNASILDITIPRGKYSECGKKLKRDWAVYEGHGISSVE